MEHHIGPSSSSNPNPNSNPAPIASAMETLTLTPKKKIENLPRDLIQDILSRLPIHSLFQTRQVSPSWRSLIKNDSTVSIMHYTRSTQNPNQPTSLIFLEGMFETTHCKLLRYLHDIDSLDRAIESKPLPFEQLFRQGLSVVGSCNGFLCLTDALDMMDELSNPVVVVCNPVNGDWIKLPRPPREIVIPSYTFFGFGYNHKKSEYKVIVMEDGHVQVLTLGGGTNTWRSIETTKDVLWDHLSGVHVNGFLNWFFLGDSDEGAVGIKSFNLENETFEVVSLPNSLKGRSVDSFSLGGLGGCLMIVDHSQMELQPVWLMKDYVSKSWNLEFVISAPLNQPRDKLPFALRPLSMQKNGNVLMQSDFALFSYDPKARTHELVSVPGLPRAFTATPHVGTLAKLEDVIGMPADEEDCLTDFEEDCFANYGEYCFANYGQYT